MIWKRVSNNQLYVYFNGELIYKRWLKDNYGVIMELYGPNSDEQPRTDFINRIVREHRIY